MFRLQMMLALAACILMCVPAGAADGDDEINAVLPLTGLGATLGIEERDALRTLEVRVNNDTVSGGRHVHFVVADDRSDPATAAKLAADLAAHHVAVILGSALAADCAAMQRAVANGPLLYCLAPDFTPASGADTFASGFSTRDLIDVSLRYLHARGLTNVAIVTTSDAAGAAADRAIDDALNAGDNRAMHVVAREHIAPGGADALAAVTRMKASNAQATIAWVAGTAFGAIVRAAHDTGLATPMLVSNGNLSYDQMLRNGAALPAELLFPAGPAYAPDEVPDKATRAVVDAFLAEFSVQGVRPDNGQTLAWDPGQLVIAALRSADGAASATQLRAFIANQRNWIGINGSYNFRALPQRGVGPSGVVIVRWDATYATWAGASRPGGLPLKADAR